MKTIDDKVKPKIAKIISKPPGDTEVIGRLEPEEYWEWRTNIEELLHSKSKIQLAAQNVRIKELETALTRRDLFAVKTQAGLVKVEYNELKSKLEKKHKIDLTDTTIEGTNFEIRLVKNDKEQELEKD